MRAVGRWPHHRLAARHAVDHDVQEAADHEAEKDSHKDYQAVLQGDGYVSAPRPEPPAHQFVICIQARSQNTPATTGGETPAPIAPGTAAYSTSSKILNMGRYIEITMAPTMPPTITIIKGSMIEVRAFTAASTSDS